VDNSFLVLSHLVTVGRADEEFRRPERWWDVTTFKLPNHLLTLEEWDDLPEEGYRWAELAEGVLQVSPSPAMKHQLASSELLLALGPTARVAGFRVVTDMDVLVNPVFPATVRRPDLSIVDLSIVELSSADPERLVARNVVLAVEIVSPGSGHRDRVTKLSEYAKAGISNHWILDIAGPAAVLDVFELEGQAYRRVQHADGGTVVITAPFTVAIDVDALLTR
jgi:Uma2 family endonuclease